MAARLLTMLVYGIKSGKEGRYTGETSEIPRTLQGCGYCQMLTPEWEKAATRMRKLVGVAAVDVVSQSVLAVSEAHSLLLCCCKVTHQAVAQHVMSKYGFQVLTRLHYVLGCAFIAHTDQRSADHQGPEAWQGKTKNH